MTTWISHLRLAENLLALIPELDEAQFGIGNIAPDSGIPNEDWSSFDPPTEITHFKSDDPDAVHTMQDLEFYRRYRDELSEQNEDIQQRSFLLGYFFHLLTDNLWRESVSQPTHVRFAAELEKDPKFVWIVKHDWYGLDFEHVNKYPDGFYWQVFQHANYDEDYLDFVPAEGIRQNIAHIKEFYQRKDESVEAYLNRPNLYLSKAEMDTFVEEATQKLSQIYALIWEQEVETESYISALELVV